MGEANIKLARSEYDEAVLLCKEIIRQGISVFHIGLVRRMKLTLTCICMSLLEIVE